jgi:hypothetical protein
MLVGDREGTDNEDDNFLPDPLTLKGLIQGSGVII